MNFLEKISYYIPIVKEPRTMLTFNERLRNTLILLALYFILSSIPIWGVSPEISQRLRELAWMFGSSFGTILTLGIGPIVMAGIFLQLLIGGGILNINTGTPEGREKYNAYMKGLTLLFVIVESIVVILTGTLKPDTTLAMSYPILLGAIFIQLVIGGILIIILDDYSLKYGITSGVNLFILASISKALVLRLLNPLPIEQGQAPTGLVVLALEQITRGNFNIGMSFILIILVTIGILALSAYLQAARVEVPLLVARVGGQVMKFPIKILYTSVIPIILLFALIIQIEALYRIITGSNQIPLFLQRPAVIERVATLGWGYLLDPINIIHILFYLALYIVGAAILSYLWVISSGMDAKTMAKQLLSSPAFTLRFRDPRLIERTLDKYIRPISILSGILIGFLAGISDILGTALAGTSLLLIVVIAYNIYEDLVKNNALHMIPLLNQVLSKRK